VAGAGTNQQLIGLLMGGADKKLNSSGRNSKRGNKSQSSHHHLSQGGSSNEVNMLKQFLVDKTNSVSKQGQVKFMPPDQQQYVNVSTGQHKKQNSHSQVQQQQQ
jgi:hypothetical protein